ncbi:MAG TPA: UDP-galactopyranose mutase [Prevotella sp.]|nr:UDP-galactopyranose mutase [Prevotella sp.]
MKKYDYLIVGSGLFGATFAYLAHKAGKSCLVIDKRSHLGGNIYCENIEGINVHKYGAHIFHTSNKKVWDFVNSIVEFNRYTNSPVANYKGQLYNLPFNMNTFHEMWGVKTPDEAQAKIDEQKAEAIARMKREGIVTPRNLEEQALTLIGKDIYERLIKGYTEKQWGRKCKELPAFIINRLPVRLVFDNNYFNDCYQGIPIGGYNKLTAGLLKDIDTITGIDFFAPLERNNTSEKLSSLYKILANAGIKLPQQGSLKSIWENIADHLVYTGQIDEYFNYKYGKLNFRTVRFNTEIKDMPNYQGNAVINYTEAEIPYTRIIEHKHFESFGQSVYDNPKTVISREYSMEWQDGMEPYYPINDEKNTALFTKYKAEADKLSQTFSKSQEQAVIFGGRLAEYKYYDMAPIIEKVLNINI